MVLKKFKKKIWMLYKSIKESEEMQCYNGLLMGSVSVSGLVTFPTIVSVCVFIINGHPNSSEETMMASRDFKLVVLLITFVPIMGKPMEKRNQDSDCCPTNRFMVEGDRDFLPERRIYEDESNDYAEPCASIRCAKKRGGGPVQFDLLDYMHGMKQRAGGVHSTVTGLKNPVTVWTWEKGMHPVE